MKKIAGLLLSLLLIFSACSTKEQADIDASQSPGKIVAETIVEPKENVENLDNMDKPKSTQEAKKETIEKTNQGKNEEKNSEPIKTDQEKIENKDASTTNENTPKIDADKQQDIKDNADIKDDVVIDSTTGATQKADMRMDTQENIVRISIQGDEKTILDSNDIEFKTSETVFDVLLKITKEKKIHMDFSGSKDSAYIKGIDNLYEFDKGPNSGWKYTVNGVYPAYSAGDYKLEKGDIIKWIYVK